MWEFEHSIEAPVARERVWALWTDVSNWPSWNPGVGYAELDGPLIEGATGTVHAAGGPTSTPYGPGDRARPTLRDGGLREARAFALRARAHRRGGRAAAHHPPRPDDRPSDASASAHDRDATRALDSGSARGPGRARDDPCRRLIQIVTGWEAHEVAELREQSMSPENVRGFACPICEILRSDDFHRRRGN